MNYHNEKSRFDWFFLVIILVNFLNKFSLCLAILLGLCNLKDCASLQMNFECFVVQNCLNFFIW